MNDRTPKHAPDDVVTSSSSGTTDTGLWKEGASEASVVQVIPFARRVQHGAARKYYCSCSQTEPRSKTQSLVAVVGGLSTSVPVTRSTEAQSFGGLPSRSMGCSALASASISSVRASCLTVAK